MSATSLDDVRSQRRVQRIEVSISTRRKKACLFVQGNGKLSRPRPCSEPLYVRAQPVSFRRGKTTWKLDRPVTLRPGTYTAIIRATDREGNVETAKRRTNRAQLRVR